MDSHVLVSSLHYRELEIGAYGVGVAEGVGGDPLIADIHSEFTASMMAFEQVKNYS